MMLARFEDEIEKLNQRVGEQAFERLGALLLMTHPGVGPVRRTCFWTIRDGSQTAKSSGQLCGNDPE
jgi:transposase